MKKHLIVVALLLVGLIVAPFTAAAQTSPIAFRQGDWKIGIGNGKLTFEDGTMHVADYKGWNIIQFGANSDAGQFSLLGYTGLQLEVKVEEATTIQIAIQLEDWAFKVVHEQTVDPSEDWVTVDVDLSGYDLSIINALCIQGSGADFSARNIIPTPFATQTETASDVQAAASDIKITGKTELDVTVRKVELIAESQIGFNEDDWKLEEDAAGKLTFDGNSIKITDYPGWTRIERKKGDDLSQYTGIQFEVKVEGHSNVQFIIQPKDWSWNQIYEVDHSPDDGWVTVTIDFAEKGLSPEDMSEANALIFQAGAIDWAIRNIVLLPLEDVDYRTDFERDYKVELNLAYTINDDWTASVATTFAEESFKVGLVEVKGTPGDLNVRAFANGTGAGLGDPLKVIDGSKYNKDKTFGVDLKAPVYTGTGHLFLSTPVKPDPGKSGLVGGSFETAVAETTEVKVLAATEYLDDPEQKNPYVLGAVASTAFDNGIGLTGEVLTSGKKGLGFYGKVSWKELEAGVTHAPAELWTNRGDFHAQDGYGTYYVQGNTTILEGLKAGFYFNQWYNHKEENDKYKNYFFKVNADWTINEKASLSALYEQKMALNNATKRYDTPEGSKLILTLKGELMEDLTGNLFGIFTNEGAKNLKVPALVGRLTYTGLDKWTFVGELGLAKASSTAKFENNIHLRAKYAFSPSGSIELGFGKPTLNADDDAVANRSTPKQYYTLKFRFSF